MANDKLTWLELRKAVAEYANTSEQEAGQFLSALLEGVVEGLKTDKQVKIKGLGSFSLKAVAPRKSVNIATGETFTIEGYNKLTFNAESMLKESVEKRLEQPKTEAVMAEINNDPIKKLGEQATEIVDILAELGQAVNKPSLEEEEVLEVPKNKGHLEVLALSGLIGQRSECSSKLIFVGAVEGVPIYFKFTYPQFLPQKHLVDAVEISLSNGEVKKAALVENFDAAVLDDVKSKQYGAFNRSVVRNIVKNATALTTVISSRILMENAPSDVVRSIAQISYNSSRLALPIAMPLIVDAEKADIRQAVFFPHMANSAGFSVKPGSYDVTIRYLSKGEVVEEEIIKDVFVENGKVTVVAGSTAK